MNQVHGDHVELVEGPRAPSWGLDNTPTPWNNDDARACAGVVTVDCAGALMADDRRGIRRTRRTGRGGQGHAAQTLEAMVAVGARVEDRCGSARSGGQRTELRSPRGDGRRGRSGAARKSDDDLAWNVPALDLRAGLARQLAAVGVREISIDPRCTVEDTALFSHRRDAPTGWLRRHWCGIE